MCNFCQAEPAISQLDKYWDLEKYKNFQLSFSIPCPKQHPPQPSNIAAGHTQEQEKLKSAYFIWGLFTFIQGAFNNYVVKMRVRGGQKMSFLSTLRVEKLSIHRGGGTKKQENSVQNVPQATTWTEFCHFLFTYGHHGWPIKVMKSGFF